MENQLHSLGLEFEIIEAIDGRQVVETLDDSIYSKKLALKTVHRELSPGEVGAALTHARVWERVAIEELGAVLVLEDDVYFGEMAGRFLSSLYKFPCDWEFINLLPSSPQQAFGNPVFDIYRVSSFIGAPYSLCAYMINRVGAKRLLSDLFPIRQPADHVTALAVGKGLIAYGVCPKLVAHGGSESSVIGEDDFEKLKITFLRRLKRFSKRLLYRSG